MIKSNMRGATMVQDPNLNGIDGGSNNNKSKWKDPEEIYTALVWFFVIIFFGLAFICLFRSIELLDKSIR
jgi:hypothetical protein